MSETPIVTTAPAPGTGPLLATDRVRWGELWKGYLAFYDSVLPEVVYAHTWERLIRPDGAIRGLGIRNEAGMLVGIAHYLFHATAWSDRPLCYLQDLYVDPQQRGHGGGRAMIEGVADAARSRNALRLYWTTKEDNVSARALYDKVGRNSGFIRYDISLG